MSKCIESDLGQCNGYRYKNTTHQMNWLGVKPSCLENLIQIPGSWVSDFQTAHDFPFCQTVNLRKSPQKDNGILLLMEEILHHLRCIKPCSIVGYLPYQLVNRISSINRITASVCETPFLRPFSNLHFPGSKWRIVHLVKMPLFWRENPGIKAVFLCFSGYL